ncbi:hypothetical protein [Sulfurimonas sp.]|uniref:tetratricopeptide repeat protein n=1 Tax=Sulfurimonas sp. TaxID=2022749 RepID=UPI0025FB063A|nr:hypothetical protein [Sulfurimonas sp.]MBW6487554.1 hypothetical protein [Sulfurimonas sp.]
MIKKTIFTIGSLLLLSTTLFASFNSLNNDVLTNNSSVTQKELNTKKDFDKMITDLKQGASLGDVNSLFYLGFIYFEGVELKDGTKTKTDKEQAKELLNKAISLGSKEAAAFLMAKSLELKDVEMMTKTTKSIQASSVPTMEKDYFSMMLASFILDYNVSSANSIEVAAKWLYEAEKKRPTPKMQLILAFMYQKLQNMDAANFYLNKSCTHEEMKETCEQIKKLGSQDEQSCQKF